MIRSSTIKCLKSMCTIKDIKPLNRLEQPLTKEEQKHINKKLASFFAIYLLPTSKTSSKIIS